MWFESWEQVLRVLITGSVSCAALVVVLRASGKRTLGQLNAFDFIVTVAFGSTLATILLSADVSVAQGAAALVLLASLQFVVAWLSARDGPLQLDQVRRNSLTKSEVLQAVRSSRSGDLSDIAVVVLETNGTFSVIPDIKLGSGSALDGVSNWRNPGTS
ncbi:DUF421 domain-containing protein [Arthrobacter sp. HLT1-21]